MEFFSKVASVIKIEPPHSVLIWWDGEARRDLLTFDEAGYKLMFRSLGGSMNLAEDVVRNNIKIFLNDLLVAEKWDFHANGPIFLDEPKVKGILGIR